MSKKELNTTNTLPEDISSSFLNRIANIQPTRTIGNKMHNTLINVDCASRENLLLTKNKKQVQEDIKLVKRKHTRTSSNCYNEKIGLTSLYKKIRKETREVKKKFNVLNNNTNYCTTIPSLVDIAKENLLLKEFEANERLVKRVLEELEKEEERSVVNDINEELIYEKEMHKKLANDLKVLQEEYLAQKQLLVNNSQNQISQYKTKVILPLDDSWKS